MVLNTANKKVSALNRKAGNEYLGVEKRKLAVKLTQTINTAVYCVHRKPSHKKCYSKHMCAASNKLHLHFFLKSAFFL